MSGEAVVRRAEARVRRRGGAPAGQHGIAVLLVLACLAVLTPFGVEEMVQTGTISMMRGSVAPRPGHPTVNARPVRAAE